MLSKRGKLVSPVSLPVRPVRDHFRYDHQIGKAILFFAPDHVRRLTSGLDVADRTQELAARGNNRSVAGAEEFPGAVDDRSAAFDDGAILHVEDPSHP